MEVKDILEKLVSGKMTIAEAEKELRFFSIKQIGKNIAKLDPGRKMRSGLPEVVLASGKKYSDLIKIIDGILLENDHVLVTKIHSKELLKLNKSSKKKNLVVESGQNSSCLLISKKRHKLTVTRGKVGILCAGTSDIGIAEEARLMAHAMGCETLTDYDVGIAGLHRTIEAVETMIRSGVQAIVVAAGMEGALPSVVSSLVDVPVIGVPTSVGYGYGSMGFAALASMLQCCSLGVAVVNINNGIGGGAFASLIANSSNLN
jgi:pyridinium-3,5-biscarboxylic acid mononucleotide synthase